MFIFCVLLTSLSVTCGYKVECPSHERIKVTVRAGQTLTKIDPGDWYDGL